MNLTNTKRKYFISDFHFGIPDYESSMLREKKAVEWLEAIKNDADEIYILGDVFDFWFEYKKVIPKGYTRFLGKLAELSDSGIIIHYFTGNHDMWVFDYFEKELNFKMYREPITCTFNNKKFFIGHGDGLGPKDYGYKFIKIIFANPICQFLFSWIHPDISIPIANFWSKRSRIANNDEIFESEEKERLLSFAKSILKKEEYNYFIFGHRHLPLDIKINEKSRYINTGDWFNNFSYAYFDGNEVYLTTYK
ncbi:MAG: UDP-2,3-diacylglucosamine diphosphatase [Bacteroidota bacterium]|nr:UDP-2,3-diacylglucosamine diphosphatase [Bacteroidota bacterium]